MISILLASLLFSTTRVDLGTLKDTDVPVTATFTYVNTATEPVRIERVQTSCGCTVVCGLTGQEIAAGGSGLLQFTYNPHNQVGDVEVEALVYVKGQVDTKLVLAAHVEESELYSHYKIQMGPLRLRSAEVVYNNRGPQVERIAVGNTSGQSITLSALMLPPGVSISTEPEVIPPGGEADLIIRMDNRKRTSQLPIILDGLDCPPSQRTLIIKTL